ncbi:MAG: hypothetical protein LRY51_08965 [Geovibrio sp.]|nr:hypothetical protein [Geovibrio sp.]
MKCARESFRHTFMSYMEAFCIGRVDQAFMDKHIKISCRGIKPEPVSGEIIISAHFGCWELAAPVLALISPLKIGLLARKMKRPQRSMILLKKDAAFPTSSYTFTTGTVQRK